MLPQHTFPGNVILSSRATSGLSPPVLPDAELEKLSLGYLAAAAKNALASLTDTPAAPEGRHSDDGESSEGFSGAACCPPCRIHFASVHPRRRSLQHWAAGSCILNAHCNFGRAPIVGGRAGP